MFTRASRQTEPLSCEPDISGFSGTPPWCAAATLESGELQTRQSQTLGELEELHEREHET